MGRLTAHPSIGVALARLREGLVVTRIPLTADQCGALISELELREQARADAEALATERLSNLMDERKRANLAVAALHALHTVALNGTVCVPPNTWQDPLMGGDGSGSMFDVEALGCRECRSAWRKVVAALADEPAAAPGDLRPLLLEWLSYTGLRHRAFADEAVEGGEYESGRDLVRRTDAALAERP